jgi:serine/threonine protein phosphatase 1
VSLTYAIADLHGRFDLLQRAEEAIAAHRPPMMNCTIVYLGDYVDRGPQSAQIIEWMMAHQEWNNFVGRIFLKGNHEDIMLQTIRKPLHPDWWIGNGGGRTLISYGHAPAGLVDYSVVPKVHLDWIDALPLMHVDEHRVFVHAGVDRFKPLDQQDQQTLTWKIYDGNDDGGHDHRHVVHGHHQFANGPILHKDRTDLDTFAWYTGRLVVGVFDDSVPGGPVETIEVKCAPDPRAA